MKRKVTIKDIAGELGVSTATISYYLNGKYENMSEELRQRIGETIRKTGYSPDRTARNLRTGKSGIIGLIIRGLTGAISFRGVNGVCDTLMENDYETMILITNSSVTREEEYIRKCVDMHCEGIIIVPTSAERYPQLREVVETHEIPVVIQSQIDPANWPYDAAALDAECVYKVMACMANKGYEHIVYFMDVSNKEGRIGINKGQRAEVFKRASRELFGLENGEEMIYYDITDPQKNRAAIEDTIQRFGVEKTSIFCINSPTMLATYRNLEQMDLKELKLCGFGGAGYVDMMKPSPVYLFQPLYEVGRTAAELMIRRLKEPDAEYLQIGVDAEIVDPDRYA